MVKKEREPSGDNEAKEKEYYPRRILPTREIPELDLSKSASEGVVLLGPLPEGATNFLFENLRLDGHFRIRRPRR